MKTVILFSLAFIFAVNSAPAPAPVLDTQGYYLRPWRGYILIPLEGLFGGPYVRDLGKKSCVPGVVLSYNDNDGIPMTFAPVNPKKDVIRLSTDVNIKFSHSDSCSESNVWRVKYDKGMKQYAVMVGGVEGNPGPETLDNWFKIEKTNDGYKFVYCPSVCSYCNVTCSDVGIVEDKEGLRRFTLSDKPLSFVFFRTY
ncbi:putative proteinase inhibitor I3, Kunitz legume, kunitz inhibitor STI-like superfamily [Helianthus annuus]|uniref:Uncharacterized protein n=1 Tax=Helianthus annuus TaxID=4232 RepID=A0A251UEP5_HELAN|nr:putative proteinase inhibitor I3, Kunitz legume, kunitz inhibitor STI-like superfamily [Helianthus annuus]KAJ0559062.1 putative proteinase inhibitor I3, Kunitz legume, kunitz inhibitor STI-like superfamily [Helianthus annuus]KAJ0572008.1 putative proteinase inhibitor I3, Kunitz legume, kunitz inhibitor STI-like superfamily [Helianthus annuus]KAJ0739416.1 putative proteinase inhibitor I3, Kunitz legume, kunitz inhibitor STI-like superfamily [Helianthus annuus]KAJ0910092.1 putative proteinase 